MTIQKEDLLAVADQLLSGETEACWRSAVSRAYYAAYHGCDDWHNQLPVPGSDNGPRGGTHQVLINRLRNPAPGTKGEVVILSRILAAKLEVLRGDRHVADYRLDETLDEARALRGKVLAVAILEKLAA